MTLDLGSKIAIISGTFIIIVFVVLVIFFVLNKEDSDNEYEEVTDQTTKTSENRPQTVLNAWGKLISSFKT